MGVYMEFELPSLTKAQDKEKDAENAASLHIRTGEAGRATGSTELLQ